MTFKKRLLTATLFFTSSFILTAQSGWVTESGPDFKVAHPQDWQVSNRSFNPNDGSSILTVADPGEKRRTIMVMWLPGVENKPDLYSQCATADSVLTDLYHRLFEKLETPKTGYPYTSVTHDAFQPGRIGGETTTVTVTHVEAYQLPITTVTYVNAIPRKGGFYVVLISHPSDPWNVSQPFINNVLNSLVMRADPLPANAPCNYLAP